MCNSVLVRGCLGWVLEGRRMKREEEPSAELGRSTNPSMQGW